LQYICSFSTSVNGSETGLLRVNLELHKRVGGERGAAGAEVERCKREDWGGCVYRRSSIQHSKLCRFILFKHYRPIHPNMLHAT